jgi:hypothetical protein
MDKIEQHLEKFYNLEYEKATISYFQDILNTKKVLGVCPLAISLNKELQNLLKIIKVGNKYYCCKNRCDLFIQLNLHEYFKKPMTMWKQNRKWNEQIYILK